MEQTGWTLSSFNEIHLHIQKVDIFPGGTYQTLPQELSRRKGLINVDNSKNNDNKCFLWSILAHFIGKHTNNPSNLSNYIPYMNLLSTKNLTFPVVSDNNLNSSISKFEYDNNLIINIYTLSNGENPNSPIAPIRISNNVKQNYQQIIDYYDQNILINLNAIQKSDFEKSILDVIKNVNTQTINLFLYKNPYMYMYISNFNCIIFKTI